MPDCIHAQITANLKTALQGISWVAEVDEMRSALDRDSEEFILLQELPVDYNDDFQHTNDVTYGYNIVYFGAGNDEKPAVAFANQNRNIVADIIKAVMTDRTRGSKAQNTVVVGSGPGFYTDDSGVIPITFVSVDVRALVDADNPYLLAGA